MTNPCTCKAEHWQRHKAGCPKETPNVIPESHYRTFSYEQLVQMCKTADTANWQARAEILQLRGNLSLAEDRLAAAMQEIERLQKELQGVRLGAEGMGWAPRAAPEPVAAPIDYQCRKCGSSDVIPWPRAAEKSEGGQ